MKYAKLTAAGLLALAACATSQSSENPEPLPEQVGDGGAPVSDAGPIDAVDADADADPGVDVAERPLICGDAGFCETRIPNSDQGLPPSLHGVWTVAPNDVWSVSAEGSVLHWDGAIWTTAHRSGHALRSVWATPTSVWVGGEGGGLFHKSAGGDWSRVESGRIGTVRAIYGTSDNDVWFAFSDDSVSHFDGAKLTNQTVDIPGLRITTVFGGSGPGAYAAGYIDSSTISEDLGVFDYKPHVFELSPTEIVPFNESLPSSLPGFAPMSGAVIDTPGQGRQLFLTAVAGSVEYKMGVYVIVDKENVVSVNTFVGYDAFFFDNTGAASPPPHQISLPIWGRASDDIYVATNLGGIYRWNGTELNRNSLSMGYKFVPRTIWGIHGNATETWVVGDGYALKGASQ